MRRLDKTAAFALFGALFAVAFVGCRDDMNTLRALPGGHGGNADGGGNVSTGTGGSLAADAPTGGGDAPMSSGGGAGNGGSVGTGGATGSGGVSGGGSGGSSYGLTCTTTQECGSYATCCDGSNESCDGTRLPSGDGTNSGQFVVSGDALNVTDTITGLLWQRDGSGVRTGCGGSGQLACRWAEAKAYCAGLTLSGLSGWRLPAVMELRTIVDLTRTDPSIDPTAFPSTPSDGFWTSSPCAGSSRTVWKVHFGDGGSTVDDLSVYSRVRCVR